MTRVMYIIFLGICLQENDAATLSRIVGGYEAILGQFPWTVSLRSKASSSHFCGGSFVTRQHVLTAAHCVVGNDPEAIFIVSGTISLAEGGENHDITHVRTHEDYHVNGTMFWQNDIAVLRLSSPVELSSTRMLLPLPSRKILESTDCTLSGWGRTYVPGTSLPVRQQYLHTTTLELDECQAVWGSDVVSNIQLCTAPVFGRGMCNGDSGSPLVCNGELAGIASWANPCANGIAEVYANVYTFLEWITENTADLHT